jgi:exodeoxyribonuclease VII large subunit
VQFVETRVQGDGAQIDIGEAIDKASRLDVDVIVLTRGGGSYEDLFAFNLEPVVRAIVRAKRPVLSAVGHTGDVHLSDYVADYACETPSNAAQYFGEIADRFLQRVQRAQNRIEHAARSILTARAQAFDYAGGRLSHAVQSAVRDRERNLHALERRLNAQTPQSRLLQRAQRLATWRSRFEASARYVTAPRTDSLKRFSERLERLTATALRPHRDVLSRYATVLEGLNPHALLARGYAIVTVDGHTVRDARTVAEGALIEAQLQHGKLRARVEGTE